MIRVKRMAPVVLAVNSLDGAIPFYQRVFGARFGAKFEQTSARFAPFLLGDAYFELAEPSDSKGGIARFLKSKGQGVWMLTFQVDNIEEAKAELKRQGIRIMIEETIDEPLKAITGVTWHKQMIFMHPDDTGGALMILCETIEPDSEREPVQGPKGQIEVKGMERISFAAEKFDQVVPFFEKVFGVQMSPELPVESQAYDYRYFNIGETSMEVLVPTSPESVVARFIKARGRGIYHITLEIKDLAYAINALKAEGIPVIGPASYPVQPPYLGWREAFPHPKYTFGVLFALAQISREMREY